MRAVFYNGNYTDFESARIPLTDRCVFFGDGVYDVLLGHGGGFYLQQRHSARFFSNIEKIGLSPSFTESELLDISRELVRRSGEDEYILYWLASG